MAVPFRPKGASCQLRMDDHWSRKGSQYQISSDIPDSVIGAGTQLAQWLRFHAVCFTVVSGSERMVFPRVSMSPIAVEVYLHAGL